MDASTLAKLGEQVRSRLDQDGPPPSDVELVNPVNELRLVTRLNGRTAFRGELDPQACALLHTVLSPLARPRPSTEEGPEPRTAAERHGDALVEILRLAADGAGLPAEAGRSRMCWSPCRCTICGTDWGTDWAAHCWTAPAWWMPRWPGGSPATAS
jgi:hypothetical protein